MTSSSAAQRAGQWLEAWDAQGWHRTGNPGDHLAADWLVSEARAMGAEASLLRYKLDRLEPVVGRLEVAGEVIEGLPLFDAPLKADIRGQLGPAGSAAAIGIARFEPEGSSAAPMRELRMQTSHAGLVIITSGVYPGLSPVNADHFGRPYGPPALQVSSAHADLLEAAALRGDPALLAGGDNGGAQTGGSGAGAYAHLLHSRVHVGWPYLREAMVVAVSDAREKITGARGVRTPHGASEWNAETQRTANEMLTTRGLDVSRVDVTLHCRACEGLVRHPDGSLQKRFAKTEMMVPIQLVIAKHNAPSSRMEERPALDAGEAAGQ